MALTYLAGGRTLTGVIFQPKCQQQQQQQQQYQYEQQQQQQQQQQQESSSVSPTLRPLVCAIGGLSSFLTRQSLSPPPTPTFAPSSSIDEPAPPPRPVAHGLLNASYTLHEEAQPTTKTRAREEKGKAIAAAAAAGPATTNTNITTNTSDYHDKAGQSLILRRHGPDTIAKTLANDPCVTSTLVDLNLSRSHLTDLPDLLADIPNLHTLNVSSNLLSTIPRVLFRMPQLQTLNLSDNQLTDIPANFPPAVPNLVQLLLFGNLLTSLPETMGSGWTQLQQLQLGSEFSGNRLTELPLTMPPTLQVLDISHNQLRHIQSLTRLTSLVQLDVSYNHLRGLPKSVATSWQRIRTINFSNNRIRSLPEDLVELDCLELLNVSYNLINVFPEGLLEKRQLNVLITANPLSYPGEHRSAFTRVLAEQRHRRRSGASSTVSSPSDDDDGSSGSSSGNSDTDSEDDSGVSSDSSRNETGSTTVVLEEHHQVNFDTNNNNNNNNFSPSNENTLLMNHLSSSSNRTYAAPEYDDDDDHHDPGVNSLYELAFRQVLQSPSNAVPPNLLPDHLSQIREDDKQAHVCVVCKGPYLREWVSSTYCRSYRGYPSVARKIRFCSRQCSRRHAEKAREIAERQSTMRMPPGPIDFGSFEWIAAAADAAAEQQAGEEDWF